jgi:predicted nuclease of predicted toxin-antitoxin system
MARLYANENFPADVVTHLRALGHDVLTTHDSGKSNRGIEDEAVLRFAVEQDRCVVTINRRDFIRLHQGTPDHAGIIVCTENRNYADFAKRIDTALNESGADLKGKLLRVVRGDPS